MSVTVVRKRNRAIQRFANNLDFQTNMAILRSKWDVLDFLLKRPATTKEILAHFSGTSVAIVMIYVESLQREHSIELRDNRWCVRLDPKL